MHFPTLQHPSNTRPLRSKPTAPGFGSLEMIHNPPDTVSFKFTLDDSGKVKLSLPILPPREFRLPNDIVLNLSNENVLESHLDSLFRLTDFYRMRFADTARFIHQELKTQLPGFYQNLGERLQGYINEAFENIGRLISDWNNLSPNPVLNGNTVTFIFRRPGDAVPQHPNGVPPHA